MLIESVSNVYICTFIYKKNSQLTFLELSSWCFWRVLACPWFLATVPPPLPRFSLALKCPWMAGYPHCHQPLPPMKKSSVHSKGTIPSAFPRQLSTETPKASRIPVALPALKQRGKCASFSLCHSFTRTRLIKPRLLAEPHMELVSALRTQTLIRSTAQPTHHKLPSPCFGVHVSVSTGSMQTFFLRANVPV